MWQNNKKLGFILGFILTLTFLYSLILNISKPLSLIHGDAFLVNFILNHYMKVFSSGNFSQLTTLPMFYGFKNSLFYTDHHFLPALMALPFYILTGNIITTSNLLIVLTIILSFYSMYILLYHWTKKIIPSLLGAIIFVFNPFIFARFPDQFILFALQWIPLIFLFFEKTLKKPDSFFGFFFFLFLTFQLLTSLYYSVFLTVILPIYMFIRLYQEKTPLKKFINAKIFVGSVIFLMAVIFSGWGYYQVFSKESINRDISTVSIYSAWVSDYLFTSDFNILYGNLKQEFLKKGALWLRLGIYSEHSLFAGILPLFLLGLSFGFLPKSKYRKYWFAFLIILIISFLLSLGPDITFTVSHTFPGPYRLIYKINPLFGFLRTPARFGVFFFFSLSIIIALTTVEIFSRLKSRLNILLNALLVVLILIEYFNKPLAFTDISPETIKFYQALNKQTHIKVILDYPIGNSIPYPYPQARVEDFDAHYLLWASILHHKILFNGYSGFLPAEYYRRANFLSMNFPTVNKLKQLKNWGVDAIVLHKDEFNQVDEFERINRELKLLGVAKITSTDNLVLFDLAKWKGDF
jgi:hypothetical protein